MGLTKILANVGKGKNACEVNFLVDSGAIYTLLPEKVWQKLKLKPFEEKLFSLVDGTTITRKISEVWFEYKGIGRTTPVILGEGNDKPLLGTITLEIMGLILNPFSRELMPMKLVLAMVSNNGLSSLI